MTKYRTTLNILLTFHECVRARQAQIMASSSIDENTAFVQAFGELLALAQKLADEREPN